MQGVSQDGTIYINPNATVYLTIGTAGALIDEKNHVDTWSAIAFPHYGFGLFDVNNTHLHYTFIQMDEAKIGDEFWIIKQN